MAARLILTLSTAQLDVVRDALALVGTIGVGSLSEVPQWWGNPGGHGNLIAGDLQALTRKMVGLHPRGISAAPRAAQVAWDIAAAIRLAQAASRLKRTPDYSGLVLHTDEPCARLDCLHAGDNHSQGSLADLEAIPVSPPSALPPLRLKLAAPKKDHTMAVSKNPLKKSVKKVVAKKAKSTVSKKAK